MNIENILKKHLLWLNQEDGGERADLSGANLSGANLIGADLIGANLNDAKTSSPIIVFNGPQHQAIYCQGYVRIGCQYHSLKDWVEQYEAIGKEAQYSADEIRLYGDWLMRIKS